VLEDISLEERTLWLEKNYELNNPKSKTQSRVLDADRKSANNKIKGQNYI
jgi:hypothetical protein